MRALKNVKIGNTHASVSNTVSIIHTDGTTAIELEKVTLLPGERMGYEEGTGLRVFDALGREKVSNAFGGFEQGYAIAQGPGFAADTYIAGSSYPIAGRIAAGSFFRWTIQATKTAAGVATPIFVIRTGTAGTTADTARCTLTLAAQSATAADNYYTLEAVFRSVGSGTNAVLAGVAMGETNFSTAPGGVDQAVSSGFDSTTANLLIGLSVNGGTSAAWTIQSVTLQANALLS
jgi:hypothetical protein